MSLAVPVRLTSLDPQTAYSESCRTFVVNRHGCGVHAPQPLPPQTAVVIEVGSGKATAQARVVMCAPVRGEKDVWEMGIELDSPENIWGIQFPPSDWITGESTEPLRAVPARTVLRAEPEPRLADAAVPAETTAVAPPSVLPPPAPASIAPAPVASAEPVGIALETPVPAPEVSFSLNEISEVAQSSTPLSPEPPTFTEETAPPPAASPEAEAELRGRARAIAAEFEEDYRRSLGELLARLRADLEEQTAADWERHRRQALDSLHEVAEETREQLVEESAARGRFDGAQAANLEKIRQAQDYVESLIRVLPETVDQRLQEALAARAEQWQHRMNEEHAAREHEVRAQLEQHCQALKDEMAAQGRQRLFDDLDRHEREFLDRITVRLEDVRASADHTREFTKRASADIARQSEQLRVDLQSQFELLFEEHRRSLSARLEERHQRLDHAARAALEALGGRLWESLRQQLQADFEARNRELRETLQAAQSETRHLREHTERLAARLDAGLQARLDQAVEEAAGRAQSRFQQLLDATQDDARRQLQADQEQARAGHAQACRELAESLHAQRASLLAEFKRDTETAAADALLQFQGALRQTLDSIGEILGPKPPQPGTNLGPGAKEL